MADFYPTLVSSKMNATINFYEDYFGFLTLIEGDGYAILRSQENPEICIAVCDVNQAHIEGIEPVKGLFLTFPSDDVTGLYDRLYMEGLDFLIEPGHDALGNNRFIVRDPNGVMVKVSEPLHLERMAA